MESVNQTRSHCVNQMGKIHSKSLAAQHGRGKAWARHILCESDLTGKFSTQGSPWQNGDGVLVGMKRSELWY